MTHSLTLGALDLTRGEGDGYWFETLADGVSFGSAAGRDVIVKTLLQDGAAVSRDGYENREGLEFPLMIKASDALGLAQGEADLAAEVGRRNELIWTPPDGWGPPSVYTVVMSSMDWNFDDWGEMEPSFRGRPYVLRVTAKPFVNSVDWTVIEAVTFTGDQTTVQVDDGSSTTGWSGNGAVGIEDGCVYNAVPASFTGSSTLALAVSLDLSVTDMIVVDWRINNDATEQSFGAAVDGIEMTRVGSGPSPIDDSLTRVYFRVPTGKTTAASVSFTLVGTSSSGGVVLFVGNVLRTNVPPSIGTGRQLFRSLLVPGSARTEGSLEISHDSSSLGEVLVYTNQDDRSGYQPPCQQYKSAGATSTLDSSSASGYSALLNGGTPETYDIPSRAVPEGTYAAVSRLKAASAGYYNVTLTASLLSGSTKLGSVTTTRSLNIGTSFGMFELGALALPTVAVPKGSQAKVRLELSADGAVSVDDTYIFNVTIGALTWVDCGSGSPATGGSSNRLWIDTASLDVPRPAIWVGTQADRSDAHHIEGAMVRSEMPHRFERGDVNLCTVTSNALYAAASLRFRAAWHSNAAA